MAFGKRKKKDETMHETSQTSESAEEQAGAEAPLGYFRGLAIMPQFAARAAPSGVHRVAVMPSFMRAMTPVGLEGHANVAAARFVLGNAR